MARRAGKKKGAPKARRAPKRKISRLPDYGIPFRTVDTRWATRKRREPQLFSRNANKKKPSNRRDAGGLRGLDEDVEGCRHNPGGLPRPPPVPCRTPPPPGIRDWQDHVSSSALRPRWSGAPPEKKRGGRVAEIWGRAPAQGFAFRAHWGGRSL